ncbi:hypothetical protein [Polaromonas eurypsychrophila]|nr:hypothetical protein [Polaromonas eurypsychrophila]
MNLLLRAFSSRVNGPATVWLVLVAMAGAACLGVLKPERKRQLR